MKSVFHPGSAHTPAACNGAIPAGRSVNDPDDARNLPYMELLVDAGCSVHDPHVPEYPGVDIFHELD